MVSQSVAHTFLGIPKILIVNPQGQNTFVKTLRGSLPFTLLTFAQMPHYNEQRLVKLLVALVQMKALDLYRCTMSLDFVSYLSPYTHFLKPLLLKNGLAETGKIILFITSQPSSTSLLHILWDQKERTQKALLLHTKIQWLSRGKAICDCLSCKLNSSLFHGTPLLLDRKSDKQNMVIQTWVSGSRFLENK